MFALWNLTLTLVLCSLAVSCVQSIQPFSDGLTLRDINICRTNVKHLGSLIVLPTKFRHKNAFPCTFTIHKRTRQTEVVFNPRTYCFNGNCGEYTFNLHELAESGFDPNARTIILIPGYWTEAKVEWIEEVASLWLAIEDVNVIKVSWKDGNRFIYEKAVSGTPIVAREITILLHHLAGLHGLEFTSPEFANKIQIVGHSLGAHIGAFVGQDLGGRVGRITGLDPAGVFFDLQARHLRLDPTDARFVDVIHTNSGKFDYTNWAISSVPAAFDWFLDKVPGVSKVHSKIKTTFGEGYSREANTAWYGINQQVGHVDFYANNGKVQPACDSYMHLCDHGRATEIYVDHLDHELRMLDRYGRSERKENRLLAFLSDDYGSFFTGTNLASKCRPLLETGPKRQNLHESMKRCSLPMDFSGQVDDLIREYSDNYGIESFKEPNRLTGQRYYFSTRGEKPFVGNHFMLKIYPSNILWGKECRLKAEIELPSGLVSAITLPSDSEQAVGIGNIMGDELNFSGLFTAPTLGLTDSLVASSVNQSATPVSWAEGTPKFLPSYIRLSVSSVGTSHSTIMATANKIRSWFSVKKGPTKCSLIVSKLEVLPLIDSERAIAGRYKDLGYRLEFLSPGIAKDLVLRKN